MIINDHVFIDYVDIETVPTKIDIDFVKTMTQRAKLTREFKRKHRNDQTFIKNYFSI